MKYIITVFFILISVITNGYSLELKGSTKGFPVKLTDLSGLIDENGTPFDVNQFKGKVLLITYGYTTCPHVCPTILSFLKEVEEKLNGKGLNGKFKIIFITVDPIEDTPEKISEYKKFSQLDSFIFLTGSKDNLKKVWEALNVYVEDKGYKVMKHGSHEMKHRMIDHTAKLTVVDKKGYIREEFLGMYIPVNDVVEDVIKLINE
ncbi:SCO family protein [Persephonella sp.]